MPKLIIATHPPRKSGILQPFIDSIVPWRRMRVIPKDMPRLGGHYAVTRSACAGLTKLGADWAYATDLADADAEVIVVLAGVGMLRQAIALKRAGRCCRLFAGPNVCQDPLEQDALLQAPEIDGVITPSERVSRAYVAAAPALAGRTHVWAAGIDPDYWHPSGRTRDTILVYSKFSPRPLVALAQRVAGGAVRRVATLSYRSHRLDEYRDALDRASACIFLTAHESQGIALAEAWSMNVPTFVPRPEGVPDRATSTTSAPYLSDDTGRFWMDETDLARQLAHPPATQPRAWVLANMTDEISVRNLLHIVGLPEG